MMSDEEILASRADDDQVEVNVEELGDSDVEVLDGLEEDE